MVGIVLGSDTAEEIHSSYFYISVMLIIDTRTPGMWSSQRDMEICPHQNWEVLKAEGGQSQTRMETTCILKQER